MKITVILRNILYFTKRLVEAEKKRNHEIIRFLQNYDIVNFNQYKILTMKPIIIIYAMVFGLFSCNTNENKTISSQSEIKSDGIETKDVTYFINTKESILQWKGSMIGLYAHEGTLSLLSGSLTLKNDTITNGVFTVDLNSMKTTDSDDLYKKAPREKLVGHLKSDDFFGVEKFPTAKFKIKKVEKNMLTGDLTIRGITNPEKITDITIINNNEIFSASGKLAFDRQKYGITYKNTMGDMVISDEITLTISITGNKNK